MADTGFKRGVRSLIGVASSTVASLSISAGEVGALTSVEASCMAASADAAGEGVRGLDEREAVSADTRDFLRALDLRLRLLAWAIFRGERAFGGNGSNGPCALSSKRRLMSWSLSSSSFTSSMSSSSSSSSNSSSSVVVASPMRPGELCRLRRPLSSSVSPSPGRLYLATKLGEEGKLLPKNACEREYDQTI